MKSGPSIGKATRHEFKERRPGPGQYEVNDSFADKVLRKTRNYTAIKVSKRNKSKPQKYSILAAFKKLKNRPYLVAMKRSKKKIRISRSTLMKIKSQTTSGLTSPSKKP